MKQIKYLVALALAASITVPAMAEQKVTFSGSAKVRYGFQAMEVDKNSMESIAFLASLKENDTLATQAGFFASQPAIKAGIDAAVAAGMTKDAAVAAVWGSLSAPLQTALTTAGFNQANMTTAYKAVTASDAPEALLTGQKQEQAARLNVQVQDDKLTVKIGAELDSNKEFDLKQAAFSFDYGFGAVTYDAAGVQNRWNADIFYVDDYNKERTSVDFTFIPGEQMGNVFFTLISNRANNAPAKYENSDNRVIPIMQLGYEYTSAMVDAKVGGVYDKYKGEVEANDYTGYLGFANVTVKLGNIGELETGSMAFGCSGVYGQNVSAFAAMDPVDIESVSISLSQIASMKDPKEDPILVAKMGDDDSKVWGAHAFFATSLWKGGLIYADIRYSELTFGDNDPFSAYKAQISATQYLSKNFYVMLGTGYEAYSVVAGDTGADKATGYEGVIEAGFKF